MLRTCLCDMRYQVVVLEAAPRPGSRHMWVESDVIAAPGEIAAEFQVIASRNPGGPIGDADHGRLPQDAPLVEISREYGIEFRRLQRAHNIIQGNDDLAGQQQSRNALIP